ncbi:MAG: hypothetical protein QW303_01070 [Nitrososphaerota archaeon]
MSLQIYCYCGLPAVQFQCKESTKNPANIGRSFFTCCKDKEDPNRCRFFQWKDECMIEEESMAILFKVLEKRVLKLEKELEKIKGSPMKAAALPKKKGKPEPKTGIKSKSSIARNYAKKFLNDEAKEETDEVIIEDDE